MSMWSRVKSLLGGHGPLRSIASAATFYYPDDDNAIYISGTATITSLNTGQHMRVRKVMFIGAVGANVTFTNTNTPTTAGQMFLQGSNIVMNEDDVVELICKEDGTWILVNTTA